MACENTSKRVLKCGIWITLPILTISIVVLVLFPTIYNTVLQKELNLEKGTYATEIWEDIPLPIYEKLYFFNITNARAFSRGSETLNVVEVGPYTYKSKWTKENVEWNTDATVSYKEIRTYQFVPDLSNGTEDDLIYSLNGPMILASALSENYDMRLRTLLSTLLGIAGERVVIKRSIKQLAYGGYDDLIIKFAPILKPNLPLKDGKFFWLYGKNYTDDGLFTVFTGSDDPLKRNKIKKWNGEELLNFWKGDTCNEINGTNIEYGPPIQNNQVNYNFFQSIFCRSLTLNYTEDIYHRDILSKRFRPIYSSFANSTENPDNYCFEPKGQRASGVLDVSPCQFDTPVYISYPHFYMADPSYLNAVVGLNPNEEDHGSFLDVEVITGFTINTAVRFQLNVEIRKVRGVLQTYNITNGIFPVLWVELSISIDEYFANFLKSMTKQLKTIVYSVLGVSTGVSLILAVAFIVVLYRKSERDDPMIDAAGGQYNKIVNGHGNSKKTKEEDDDTDEESSNCLPNSETSKLLK